jgi:hypothetical protein
MDWKDVAKLVGKAAPLIAGSLGGPAGTIAGTLLSGILGTEDKPDAVYERLQNDPDALAQVKTAEIEHKTRWEEIKLEEIKARLADRQSARKREIEITESTGGKEWNLYILAYAQVIGFFGLLGMMLYKPIPEGSSEILYAMIGVLGSGVMTVLAYFFGSSKSSSDKTKMLKGV